MRLANKLLGLHYKILDNLKDKLEPFIEHLLKATGEKKFYWWFCLFLDPLCVTDLKETRELHGVEGVHSKTVIFEIKAHFLYYVAACENAHNPIVAPIISTVQEVSIYSEDELESPAVMSE